MKKYIVEMILKQDGLVKNSVMEGELLYKIPLRSNIIESILNIAKENNITGNSTIIINTYKMSHGFYKYYYTMKYNVEINIDISDVKFNNNDPRSFYKMTRMELLEKVSKTGRSYISYIPFYLHNEELCLANIKANPLSFKYIREDLITKDFIIKAMNYSIFILKYIDDINIISELLPEIIITPEGIPNVYIAKIDGEYKFSLIGKNNLNKQEFIDIIKNLSEDKRQVYLDILEKY